MTAKDTYLLDNGYSSTVESIREYLDKWAWNWSVLLTDEEHYKDVERLLFRVTDRLMRAIRTKPQEVIFEELSEIHDEIEFRSLFSDGLTGWSEVEPEDYSGEPPELIATLLDVLEDIERIAHGVGSWTDRDESEIQARLGEETAKLYSSGWRAEVFGNDGGDSKAAAEDRKTMKQYRRKDGDEKRVVDLDFGMHDSIEWHCPVCGQKLFDFEGMSDNFCKHALIACVNGEEISWNDVGDDMIEGRRPDLVPTEIFVGKEYGPRPYEVLKAAYSTGTNFILSETAGGMACGPVWNTVEILFECKDDVLDGASE